jgi:hypothetical protein
VRKRGLFFWNAGDGVLWGTDGGRLSGLNREGSSEAVLRTTEVPMESASLNHLRFDY